MSLIEFLGLNINLEFLTRIAIPIAILLFTFIFAKLANQVWKNIFQKRKQFGKMDSTQIIFVRRFSIALIYLLGIVAAMLQIPALRSLSLSLFAGAGILAAIIGFASQKAFSNLISGIFIALYEPFRVGDKIQLKNYFGTVTDINLRHTTMRTVDHKFIIVPNSIMGENEIENFSIEDQRILNFVDIPVSYEADIDKARIIIGEEARKHPYFLDYKYEHELLGAEEKVKIKLTDFKDSALNLRLYIWTSNFSNGIKLKEDLNEHIRNRFANEGIEIPYPYRNIVYKSSSEKKGKKKASKKVKYKRKKR